MIHDDDARAGEVLDGRYVLGEILGVGGMGVVYAAIQRSLARRVAIKLPRRALLADDRVRERFLVEALAGARVAHRNIVRVFERGEVDGVPYLVLEYVDGLRLGHALVVDGPFSIAGAIDIIRQLADGLAEAHASGVVHGDVKCDNVLIERERDGALVPRLIDFGLARLGEGADAPRRDFVSGTPEYLAPELVRGGQPTPATDVYALGIMLYELLAGEPPFRGGSTTETLARHISGVHRSIDELREGVPADLVDVIERALAAPAARFASAVALSEALALVPTAVALPRRRLARGSSARERTQIDVIHAAIAEAHERADFDGIVVAYLELASALIQGQEPARAIAELERAVDTLGSSVHLRAAPSWRLHLLLAALHDQRGDRGRARAIAQTASAQARRVGSRTGQQRAQVLLARLAVRG